MTARVPAADDFPAIRSRRDELIEQRCAEMYRCTCDETVDARGHKTRALSPTCPVHGPPPAPVFGCPALVALAVAGYRVGPVERRDFSLAELAAETIGVRP